MSTTKSIPYKVLRSSSSFSSKELSENDRFQRRKARIQLQKRQRKTNQMKVLRTQYPQDMDTDQKDAHKQSTQQWKANLSEEQKKDYAERQRQSTQRWKANLSDKEKEDYAERQRRWKASLSEERKEGYAEADSDRHRAERDSWSTETLQQHRTQHNDHEQELRTQRWARSAGAACKCNIDSFNPDRMNIIANDLGPMIHTCNYCHAFGFESEMRYTKHMHHMGRLCCNQGQISLSTPPPFPIQLYSYFTGQSSKHKHFRKRIRYFNSGMAMASLQLNDATVYKNGPAAFKIHGQLYKRLGPMHASNFYDSGHPKCLQIYFFDPDEQTAYRVNRPYPIPRSSAEYTMDKAIFAKLQTILTSCGNPLLNKYLTINEEIKQTNISPEEVRIVLDTNPTNNRHEGRFNASTCSEISVARKISEAVLRRLPRPKPTDMQILTVTNRFLNNHTTTSCSLSKVRLLHDRHGHHHFPSTASTSTVS